MHRSSLAAGLCLDPLRELTALPDLLVAGLKGCMSTKERRMRKGGRKGRKGNEEGRGREKRREGRRTDTPNF